MASEDSMKALTYGTTGNNRAPEANTLGKGLGNGLVERQITGVTDTIKNYVMDILNPAGSTVRNIGQGFIGLGPKNLRGDSGRWAHAGKAIGGTAVDLVRGTYNATIGGAAGALDNLYRKNVTDATSELLGGTLDRFGKPGQALANLMRLGVMIPGMVPRTLNMVAKAVDKPLNWAHKKTRLSGQEAYTPDLRGPSIPVLNQ